MTEESKGKCDQYFDSIRKLARTYPKGTGEIMNRIVSIILWLVRLAVKIILLPILICLTLVEWTCIIAVGFLRMFFSLAGFIIILTAILSFCFELELHPRCGG